MKLRTLLVLLGAVLALIIAALLITLRPGGGAGPGGPDSDLLVPGLAAELNDITQIVVTGAGNRTIATLKRGDQRWTVAERDDYPADMGRIRQNLRALAQASKVEEKTSNPELYERLGVEDVARPAARGLKLTLTGPGGLKEVVLGDTRAGSDELAYARVPGEARSWLVRGRFEPGRTTGEWLDPGVLDVPATRVHSITITHPGLETLRVEKADLKAADFEVRSLPPGRTESYPGVANALGGVLASLQLEDVSNRQALGDNPGKPVVATFVTFDGLVVEASAWTVADGTRVTFVASTDEAVAKRFGTEKDYPESVRQAEAINARLAGWVYTLPTYRTEQLTRRLADLLAPAG